MLFTIVLQVEFSAEYVLALTSKTYVCRGTSDDAGLKLSCKGANKRLVMQSQPIAMFENVLETGVAKGAVNRGFVSRAGTTYTYEAGKTAFPYFYVKRDLLEIEGHTRTLPICLIPVPKPFICLQTDMPELAPDYILPFKFYRFHVQTIRQAHCFTKYMYCTAHKMDGFPDVNLLQKLLVTIDAEQLQILLEEMGESYEFSRDEYEIIHQIVEARMSEHASLYTHIDVNNRDYIVNACPWNRITGNGQNYRVTRYRPNAYLQGQNYLGRVYMSLRHRVKELVDG